MLANNFCADGNEMADWALKEVAGAEKFLMFLSMKHRFFKWILKGILKSYWPKKIGE